MQVDNRFLYYPVFLNLRNRKSVVVGGGKVAERKINGFWVKGSTVTVISPSLTDTLEAMAQQGKIHVEKRDYKVADLKGAVIAIAATDSRLVNLQVARDGTERGILVNVVDDAEHSDFILPSVTQRGDVVLAISTSGRSPALARKLRTELETFLEKELGKLAVIISEVREELKRQGKRINGESWQKCLDLPALQVKIREGKHNQVKDELRALLTAETRNKRKVHASNSGRS